MSYTHIDSSGMPWRFSGSRPVSALADRIMRIQCSPKGEVTTLMDNKGNSQKGFKRLFAESDRRLAAQKKAAGKHK